jgi:hypothetical protein
MAYYDELNAGRTDHAEPGAARRIDRTAAVAVRASENSASTIEEMCNQLAELEPLEPLERQMRPERGLGVNIPGLIRWPL